MRETGDSAGRQIELPPGDRWLSAGEKHDYRQTHRPLRHGTWNFSGLRRLRPADAACDESGYELAPNPGYFAGQLRDLDIVAAQELEQRPDADQVQQLVGATAQLDNAVRFPNVYVTPMCPSHFEPIDPDNAKLCIATMTRAGLPITNAYHERLPKAGVPLCLNGRRLDPAKEYDRYAQVVEVAGVLKLVGTHLLPAPWLGLAMNSEAGKRYIAAVGDKLAQLIDGPTMLAGDLNLAHPRQGLDPYLRNRDLQWTLPPGRPTVPWANKRLFKAAAPDQVLVTPHLEVANSQVKRTQTDHFLTITEIYPATLALAAALDEYLRDNRSPSGKMSAFS